MPKNKSTSSVTLRPIKSLRERFERAHRLMNDIEATLPAHDREREATGQNPFPLGDTIKHFKLGAIEHAIMLDVPVVIFREELERQILVHGETLMLARQHPLSRDDVNAKTLADALIEEGADGPPMLFPYQEKLSGARSQIAAAIEAMCRHLEGKRGGKEKALDALFRRLGMGADPSALRMQRKRLRESRGEK